eukprot:UN20608
MFCSTKCWFNTLLFHLHALGTCCATGHYKRRSLTILFTCTRENVAFFLVLAQERFTERSLRR